MQFTFDRLGDGCRVNDVAHDMPIVTERDFEHGMSFQRAIEVFNRLTLTSLRVVEISLFDVQQFGVVEGRELVDDSPRTLIAQKLVINQEKTDERSDKKPQQTHRTAKRAAHTTTQPRRHIHRIEFYIFLTRKR